MKENCAMKLARLRNHLLGILFILLAAASIHAQSDFVYTNNDVFPSNSVSAYAVSPRAF